MDILRPGSLDQFERKVSKRHLYEDSNRVALAYKLLDSLEKDWLDYDLSKTDAGYNFYKERRRLEAPDYSRGAAFKAPLQGFERIYNEDMQESSKQYEAPGFSTGYENRPTYKP